MRIDIAGIGREPERSDHAAFLGLMAEIDRLGYDGIWFNEFHFQSPPQPYPSLLLLAAAIFARTERLRVGTSVLVLPLHDPLLLAEQIAQLDWQSGGRIDIGIGRGTDPATLAMLGLDPDSTRDRFESAFAQMMRVWSGGERVSSAAGTAAVTPPVQPCVQRPHPPLYVAGYTEETLAFAGRHGLPLLLSLEPPETRQIEIYLDAARRHGFPSRLASSSLTRYVVIGATQADAEAQFEELLPLLQQRRVYYAARRGVAAGDVPPIDRVQVLRDQLVLGDPEQVFLQISALRRSTGIGALRCVLNGNGLLSRTHTLEQLRLFAQAVLPRLRSP